MRAERINTLARLSGAKRYLEIGVCHGETFFDVEIPFKVAVDPLFRFDYEAKSNNRTIFHPVSSDQFFRNVKYESFDIIYLDGLHTFEQTTRDFLNSLKLSHDKTIWIFDDTVPNDTFSALPDQERCYRLRRQIGGDDWSWMGDVFKTVFFIDRAMPSFHFRTFAGHGQTVVWQDKQARDISTAGIGLDKIGLMTYSDLIDYIKIMYIDTDESIFDAVRNFILRS